VSARTVESRKGAGTRANAAPFPFPAHRTGRADFPHPALRRSSPRGTRRRTKMGMTQSKHSPDPENRFGGESLRPARGHLVPSPQKLSHGLIDVVVDRSIGH